MEKNFSGIFIKSKLNSYEENRVVISCSYDTDFCASSLERERKMQDITNLLTQMHEATEGKVKKELYIV